MASDQTVKVILQGEDKTGPAFKSATQSSGNLTSKISALSKVLIGATIAAGGMAVAFGVSAVKAAMEAENSLAQLNAVLKSTSNAAGFTATQILKQASALQSLTKFSDEAIGSAQNLLLTFTNIKGPIFEEATKAVLDMSTALGQDLKSSSIQLGKALQDPILGITALRRVGVNFTDSQKDVIAALVESGKTMEAQKLILKELSVEFGGSAVAAANTFAGKIERLKNQFDDFKESVGGTIITALTPLLDSFFNIGTHVDNLKERFSSLMSTLDEHTGIVTALKDTWHTVYMEFKEAVLPVLQALWSEHGPLLIELGKSLAIVFGGILIGALQLLSQTLSLVVLSIAALITIGADLFGSVMEKWNKAIEFLANNWDKVAGAIERVLSLMRRAQEFAGKIGGAIGGFLSGSRAEGGPVSGGSSYLVGERGPEIFTPSGSGFISPNMGMAGGGSITINISGNTLLDGSAGEKIGKQIMDVLKNQLRI